MPRIPFTDLASAPEFKSLPVEEQQKVSENYWNEVAAEQPDRAEFYGQMRDASKSLFDLKAKRNDASPVQRRFLDAQVQDTAFALSLGDEAAAGRLTPEGRDAALKLREAEQAERKAKLDKTASLYKPEVQEAMAPRMDAMREMAAKGGVFGSARLDARVADFLPGGEKDVVNSSKAAYESLRNQMVSDFNLEPAEVDDVIRHQLNLQEEPVSRDAFGTPYIKDEVIAAGPDAAAAAINNSNLPWPVKQEMVKDLPAKIDRFRSGVLERVRKETPDLAKRMGIDQPGDEDANFRTLVQNLNDTRAEQFAGGFAGAFASSMEMLERGNIGTPKDASGMFGGAGAFTEENYAERTAAMKADRTSIEMVNALSSQFNKAKTEIWGTDAAAFGSGAYSVTEAVGLSLMTSGLGTPIAMSRIATMGNTGAKLATFTNRAVAVAPVAGFAGAKTAAQTYEQAIGAGKTEDEAFKLAVGSGAIEAGVTLLFSGLGAGGVEDVGQQLAGGALRQSARESAKSAYRMFGEKLALGIAGEQFEENLITALDAVAVQAKIDPSMTVDDLKQQLYDTALVTLAVSGPTVGAGALRETLAAKPTYQKTDEELQLEANLNLADATTTQPGEADIPTGGPAAPDTAPDGGAAAPGAPEAVAPGSAEPVAPAPAAPSMRAAAMPGVPAPGAAEPVLVPENAGVAPAAPESVPLASQERRQLFKEVEDIIEAKDQVARIQIMERFQRLKRRHDEARKEREEAQTPGDRRQAELDMMDGENAIRRLVGLPEVETSAPITEEDQRKEAARRKAVLDELDAKIARGEALTDEDRRAWVTEGRKKEDIPTPTTDETENQIEEASGLPPVEGQPVEPSPASQAEEGAAQRQGEGPQEVAEPVAPPTTTPEPVAEEAPPETFREEEPDWNTVFETLREREPATREVDTASPKFKALVAEIKDRRIAEKAGQLVQRKADVEEMRAKVEADRKARNDERLKRRREAAKAKPLDPYRKKIIELTKDPATGQSVNPDQEVGLRKWLRARGYDASIKKKGFLDGLLGYVVPKEKAKRERLQNLYATLTPEVKEVLDAIYKKPEKSAEEIPVFRKFAETEIGATLLRQPIRSLSSFRDAKEPIPVEYEGLVENRIKGHVQSRIFTRDPNGRTIADVIEDLNVKYAEGGLEGSMIDTQRFSAADIIQAINDLSDNKVKSQEDYDSEMERQQQEAEDAQIAFAEQQLAALQGDVQTVDIAEVRDGDVFTINGVDYRAGRVEQDDRGRTDSFVLFGEGPLNRVKVEEDFFAESVVPTEGSLSHIDPAEIEAIYVMQEFPEEFQDEPTPEPTATATEPEVAPEAEPAPQPYSPEALKETFDVTDEQAVAIDALVQAMGLDTSRIRLQQGGVPGETFEGAKTPAPEVVPVVDETYEGGELQVSGPPEMQGEPWAEPQNLPTPVEAPTQQWERVPLETEIRARIDKAFNDSEKAAAAVELGFKSWTLDAADAFSARMAEWLTGAKVTSARLASLFRKAWNAIRSTLLVSAVALNLNPNVAVYDAPVSPRLVVAELSAPPVVPPVAPAPVTRVSPEPAVQAEPVVAEAPDTAPAPEPAPAPVPTADFQDAAASSNVRIMADWVVQQGDNEGKPFALAEKPTGLIYFFDSEGVLVRKAPALYGRDPGDIYTEDQLDKAKADKTKGDYITPAGRTEARTGPSRNYGESVRFFTEGKRNIAIHKLYLGDPSQKRDEKLKSSSPADNRATMGCVNVSDQTMSEVVSPLFREGGVIYVLPETEAGKALFPGFERLTPSGSSRRKRRGNRRRGSDTPSNSQPQPESPSILYQGENLPKGSMEVVRETGDILLRGLASPDVSTGVHEIAHAARRMLLNRALPPENRKGITDEDIAIAEQWAGAENGVWTREAEEKFARGWERYLRDGKAPVPTLQAIFDKMAAWLRSVYVTVAGSPIDVDISPEMRAVLDKLVSRTLPQATPQAAPQAAPQATPQPAAPAPPQAQATTPPPPAEPVPAPVAELEPDLVGTQNAATDRRRQRAGLPPRFAPARFSNEEAWDEAMRRINKDPAAGRNLVDDLRKTPRSIDPVETALYTHELLVREQRLDDALAEFNKNPDPATEEAMNVASASVADAILTAERIGTIEGRALQARKILIHQDFTLARAVAKATAANGGQPLTSAQLKEVTDLQKEMEEVRTRLAAAEEQLAKQEAERIHVTVVAEFKKGLREAKSRGEKTTSWIDRQAEAARARIEARKREGRLNSLPVDELLDHAIVGVSYLKNGLTSIGEFTAQLVKDFGRKVLPFAGDIFAKSQELYTAAAPSGKVKPKEDVLADIDPEEPLNDKAIFQLVRHYINEGVEGFEAVMGAVLNDLREFYPDLTLRELHDAYSKYGQVIIPSKEEDLKKAREYRALARLQSQLEDAQRRQAPLKTGMQRDPATQRVRDLTKQVKDTMRRLGIKPTTGERQIKNSLDAIKSRLRNEIEDLDTAIKTREPRPAYVSEVEYDAEAKALRQRRDERKADYQAMFGVKGLTDEQRLERAEKLLDRRIAEERKMLEEGILKRLRDVQMGPWTPTLKKLKETLDKLKAERREMQKAARPKTPELEKKYQRDLASLERRIKEEEELLEKGLTARRKDIRMGTWTPQMAEMQARLDFLRDQRRELAKSLKPKKDEAQTAYEKAIKAIEASIARYKDIVAGISKPAAAKKYSVDAEMQSLLDQRDALRDAADAVRDADPARRDKKKQDLLKTIDRSIAEITRKIQDGDLSTKPRTDPFANDPDVAKVRAARDLLNKTLAAMRREKLPKRSPEEIRESRDRKMLQNKIDKLDARIKAGDYSKPVKLPPPDYKGRDALIMKKKQLEEQFNKNLLELQLAQRSKPEVIFTNTKDILFSVSRALQTSIDAGAFARQAGLVNLINPKLAKKNFPANFAFTEKAATKYEIQMENHPGWARAKSTKLSLTSWRPGTDLKSLEEDYQSRLADRVKPVLASKRAYVTYLNLVRFTYFDSLANTLPSLHQTPENLEYLANAVNALSGRGNLKIIGMPKMTLIEQAAGLLSALLFSPRYWWSRLQVLGNLIYIPVDAMTGFRLGAENTREARKIVAKEYARLVGMLGIVFSLLAFAKDFFDLEDEEFKIESDPRSGDFGKVKIGNTRIDFMAGLLQTVVFVSRFVTGEKIKDGEVIPIAGPDAGVFNSRAQLAGQMLRTKASPIAGSLVDLMVGKDINMKPTRWETELLGLYVPLQLSETYEQLRQLGIAQGAAASLSTAIGVGVQVHGDEDYDLTKDILTGKVLEPFGVTPGTFFIDQSRYEEEEKEKGWKIPKSKGLPTF